MSKQPDKGGKAGRALVKGGQPSPSRAQPSNSKALVPKGRNPVAEAAANPIPFKKVGDMLVPEGYTMREVKPAENYDVVSFARAMNDDFAPKMKKLFDSETEAAVEAQKTGIYIGFRCPDFKHDCIRINRKSRCFCDHLLDQHAPYNGRSVAVPCTVAGCNCKAYSWIPNRPEDIGEFWFQRRRNFDPTKWRAKCKCKHTHDFHDAKSRRCKVAGCGCAMFNSDFLCAACDRHWEAHETCFDTEDSRKQKGLPWGQDWLPFAEMPDLRNIALTGQENDDSRYRALTQGEGSIPAHQRAIGNDAAANFGAGGSRGGGRGGGGFRAIQN